MKRIAEWWKEGVTRVRRKEWNPWAYLQIEGKGDVIYPALKLYDIGCRGEVTVWLFELQGERFEKWEEPEDYEARWDEIYNAPIFTQGVREQA